MKYIFRLLGLLCVLTALLQTQSCGPVFPKVPDPEWVLLDEDFMAYVGLPDHSYWVYQNVETGEIDSSYIGGTDTTMQDYNYGRQIVEYLHENRRGVLYLKGREYSCRWYVIKGETDVDQIIRKYNFFSMSRDGEGLIMASKDSTDIWERSGNNLVNRYVSVHDTIKLGSQTYLNAVSITTGDKWESKASIRQTYYMEDIGPIYRKFADGSEWELIRYHIEK